MDSRYHSGAGISSPGRAELAALTGRGHRLVSVAHAASTLNLDSREAAKKLARWAEKGWLRRIRRGLYLAVPVEAQNPRAWSEDALIVATAVWSPCYFSGWTAASHWGLSEQVFRTTIVKTTERVRARSITLLDHSYELMHVPDHLIQWGIESLWYGETRITMADPARTIIDILDAPRLAGGIRNAAEILAAYLDGHEHRKLVAYAERLGNRTVFKRIGYLTEIIHSEASDLIDECRRRISAGYSLLDPDGPRGGVRVSDWKLRANVRVTPFDPS